MNIISKYILASFAISAFIAVPLSGVISDYQDEIKLQKLDNASLEIEVEKKETKEQKLEKKIKEIKQDKKKSDKQKQEKIEQLKRDLRTKREREQRESRLALTQTAQAQSEPEPEPTPDNNVQSGSCASYRSIVAQYEWNTDTMMRIMKAESGCAPTNHNYQDNHGSCMGSYGLFQIGCVHGYSVSAMENPARNIEAAYNIWKSSGYNAWTTY